MSIKTTLNCVLLSVLALNTPNLHAHGGATGVVKQRMDLMEDMKDAMKSVAAMFKGQTPYDADRVRAAAEVIRRHSGEHMTRLFPEGSLQHPSEAKPEIWEEWQRFSEMSQRLGVISEGLSRAADNYGDPAKDDSMMGGGQMMGSGHMMGADSMMGGSSGTEHRQHTAEEYGQMPVEMVFKMVSDNCSSCHTRYRVEDDK
ncbi:c-type cytochrome [Neptuniibacter halophilus]|uniref:c-type cytochrome n=1 Tax=Neptuniibacter halophilus TaxID=651666 RepID=UPI002572B518|nr:cytochrome c [Neptuniibacter halophilus]